MSEGEETTKLKNTRQTQSLAIVIFDAYSSNIFKDKPKDVE